MFGVFFPWNSDHSANISKTKYGTELEPLHTCKVDKKAGRRETHLHQNK